MLFFFFFFFNDTATTEIYTLSLHDALPISSSSAPERQDWAAYGGGPLNDHYSPLAQINRENVSQLQVAWTFDTGEPDRKSTRLNSSHLVISYAVFCLKKKTNNNYIITCDHN